MNREEMENLKDGDIISHRVHKGHFMVTANYGDRVTAVKTVDITNPDEWEIESKIEIRRLDAVDQFGNVIPYRSHVTVYRTPPVVIT